MLVFNVLVTLFVVFGIYYYIDEHFDIKLSSIKTGKKDNPLKGYFEKISGVCFEDQLIEVLLMISSCLKAGRNLDQAFELVAISTPPPICNEFKTLVQERRLGVPMVKALENLADRIPSQDLRLAINATIFQQETGGNIEDLYRQILLTISERKRIMGKIVAGTAHARLSGNIVAAIPVFLVSFLALTQPNYLKPLLTNTLGQIALLLSATATIVGVLIINRMTKSIFPETKEAVVVPNSYFGKNQKSRIFGVILKPFQFFMSLLPGKLTEKLAGEIEFLLKTSGKADDFEVEEFLGLMLFSMAALALLLFALAYYGNMGAVFWILSLSLLPIGFRLPRLYLAQLIRKRQRNIEYELPYVIDLLSLAIESGFDLVGAIAKVVEKSKNTDIIVEFKMFLADIKVGKSMEEALAEMADRVKVLSFFSFVSSLIQAQRLGADIGPTLRAQAEQMRYQRMILAEERVNKLPVKLLIPLVFFVFPSISVLLVGPAVIQIQANFPNSRVENTQSLEENSETSINEKVKDVVSSATLNTIEIKENNND